MEANTIILMHILKVVNCNSIMYIRTILFAVAMASRPSLMGVKKHFNIDRSIVVGNISHSSYLVIQAIWIYCAKFCHPEMLSLES